MIFNVVVPVPLLLPFATLVLTVGPLVAIMSCLVLTPLVRLVTLLLIPVFLSA